MTDRRSEDLGFKALTGENWLDPDPTSQQFVRWSEIEGMVQMDGRDWARTILAGQLNEDVVPLDVVRGFEVARGCMLYGWCFYPLYRLAEEESHRVLEAATKHAYRLLGGPEPVPGYVGRINWLIDSQAIPESDSERWNAARELRNVASHPDKPAMMTPGGAFAMLEAVASDLDDLFGRVRHLASEVGTSPALAPGGPWWVPGAPVTFGGGRREAEWKETVFAHVPDAPAITTQTGLAIEFMIPDPRKQDLDNLAEPVLSVVVNKRGWLGGRRPNLRWLALSKTPATTLGCCITPLSEPPAAWLPAGGSLIDEIYGGPLPGSAASIEFAAWIAERCELMGDLRYGVWLRFGSSPNLGDVATGVVKPIIDCLWPVWGGSAGQPEDWRLDRLLLTRQYEGVPQNGVAVSIWVL